MGKKELYDFLVKNPNVFFSTEELSKIVKNNYQSTRSALNKLMGENLLLSKEVVVNSVGPPVKFFSLLATDDVMEQTLFDYKKIKNDPRFVTANQELILGLMQVSELKKIHEVLQNESRKRI